jgi:syntaxin 18
MQEERAKIRSERGKSLGGLVTADRDGPGGAGGLIRRLGAGKRVGVDGKPITLTIPTMPLPEGSMKDQPNDSTLTQEQIQQFSSEHDTLLENMNTTLNTVLRAEKSLLEISQLQSSLIAHLATQTESIELLYDEAIETVADLDRANTQLKRARERGKEGRLYLVVFLVIASLALLFLDFYS